ncbi:MAG: uroporphyrinogen decarboxylase family protein [Bacteroidota bacterium]
MKTKLNGKERIKLAFEHKTTDRIPIGMLCGGINKPALRQFDALLQKEKNTRAHDYIQSFLDIVELWSFDVGPDEKNGIDYFGVQRKSISYGEGAYDEIVLSPLKQCQSVNEVDNHNWPKTDIFDYSLVKGLIQEKQNNPGQALVLGVANPFETAWAMRGLEQMFLDMMMNPDIVHRIMSRVTDFFLEHFVNFIKAAQGKIQYVFTADDLGGQTGLLLSKEHWAEFIKPYHVKMNNAFHELGLKIFYHSCGAVQDIVSGLQNSGIDALQSLQFNAEGMEPELLKEKHGDTLCFEGGVCVQKLLPYGTPEIIKEQIQKLIDIMGKNGGYILGPSHYIQAGTPPENILAMFETAKNYYPY